MRKMRAVEAVRFAGEVTTTRGTICRGIAGLLMSFVEPSSLRKNAVVSEFQERAV